MCVSGIGSIGTGGVDLYIKSCGCTYEAPSHNENLPMYRNTRRVPHTWTKENFERRKKKSVNFFLVGTPNVADHTKRLTKKINDRKQVKWAMHFFIFFFNFIIIICNKFVCRRGARFGHARDRFAISICFSCNVNVALWLHASFGRLPHWKITKSHLIGGHIRSNWMNVERSRIFNQTSNNDS